MATNSLSFLLFNFMLDCLCCLNYWLYANMWNKPSTSNNFWRTLYSIIFPLSLFLDFHSSAGATPSSRGGGRSQQHSKLQGMDFRREALTTTSTSRNHSTLYVPLFYACIWVDAGGWCLAGGFPHLGREPPSLALVCPWGITFGGSGRHWVVWRGLQYHAVLVSLYRVVPRADPWPDTTFYHLLSIPPPSFPFLSPFYLVKLSSSTFLPMGCKHCKPPILNWWSESNCKLL